MNIITAIHRRPDGTVLVAACDTAVHGKVISDGKRRIDTTNSFYTGEPTDTQGAAELFSIATHLHLVGEQCVSLGISQRYIEPAHVLTVNDVPYAECVIVRNDLGITSA